MDKKNDLLIIQEKVEHFGFKDIAEELHEYLDDIIDTDFIEQCSIDDLISEISSHLFAILSQNID